MENEYAFNVADLSRYAQDGPLSFVMLLVRPILTDTLVDCEPKRLDGCGALVRLDLEPGRFDAVLDILRGGLGRQLPIPADQLRIYQSANGAGWRKI